MTTSTPLDYEILKSEILYQGFFRLIRLTIRHRLFEGEWSEIFTRELVERRPAAAILPYDPTLDRVILIEQFRAGCIDDVNTPWQIEVPAGLLEKNEEAQDVAIREAFEEAHCEITNLHPILQYYATPGSSNEYVHLYVGKVDSRGIQGVYGLKTENEDIRVLNIRLDEALQMLDKNQIKNAPAIVLLLWLRINREKLRIKWK